MHRWRVWPLPLSYRIIFALNKCPRAKSRSRDIQISALVCQTYGKRSDFCCFRPISTDLCSRACDLACDSYSHYIAFRSNKSLIDMLAERAHERKGRMSQSGEKGEEMRRTRLRSDAAVGGREKLRGCALARVCGRR